MAGLDSHDLVIVVDAADAITTVPDGVRVIMIGTILTDALSASAIVTLPICNFAEEDGSFTNLRGRVQRFLQAKAPPAQVRPSYRVVSELTSAIGAGSFPVLASEIFTTLAASVPAFGGLSYRTLGLQGRPAALLAEVSA